MNTRSSKHLQILAALIGLLTCSVSAQTIIVGNHTLLPNTPGQQITISVSGGAAVSGLNLNVQVGNGINSGPSITGVDMFTGTIFSGNNTGETIIGGDSPQLRLRTTTTAAGTVVANGLLVTLTLDTTTFFNGSGPWALNLNNTLNGATDFAGVSANITDGNISISPVPEPSTYATVFALGSLAFAAYRRRRGA